MRQIKVTNSSERFRVMCNIDALACILDNWDMLAAPNDMVSTFVLTTKKGLEVCVDADDGLCAALPYGLYTCDAFEQWDEWHGCLSYPVGGELEYDEVRYWSDNQLTDPHRHDPLWDGLNFSLNKYKNPKRRRLAEYLLQYYKDMLS